MRNCGVRPAKRFLAAALATAGISNVLLRAQSLVHRRGHVRVVNYHSTPLEHAESLEEHLRFYAEHFCPVNLSDLDQFFQRGEWSASKPGLVISFDDGLRSNYDVAAPSLDRYGFVGWFFVPVGFVDSPVESQADFARAHRIFGSDRSPLDGRIAMSWDEVRTLATRHVVGCHTRSHLRMGRSVPPPVIQDEIVAARADLEAHLGRPVETFCWVGGEENAYSTEAAHIVRDAGYRYAFMNDSAPVVPETDPHQIQRTNIEASWSLDVVRFQLSGVMDILYLPKRNRVRRLTAR
jgi:peptidoglycan/xylan/chitin deacetylase (PgdA/CDA1 family)